MKKLNITPDERSFDTMIKFFVNGDNVELALCKISELPQNGLESNVRGVQMLIEALIQRFEARLALDVASAYEETAVRRLDNEIWVKLLGACSERLYVRTSYIQQNLVFTPPLKSQMGLFVVGIKSLINYVLYLTKASAKKFFTLPHDMVSPHLPLVFFNNLRQVGLNFRNIILLP